MAPRYSREWLDYFIPETIDWPPDGMPDTSRAVLKNLILRSERWPHGIPDAKTVHRAEGIASYQRMRELTKQPIPGRFDLPHFQRVHHHLFQDVYPWAGQLRTAPRDWPMVKVGPDVAAVRAGGRRVTEIRHAYFTAREVPKAATAVLDRIAAKDNLRGRGRDTFLDDLTKVWLRLNHVHSFREGNTRTQFAFFRQLSAEAGYTLHTDRFIAVKKADLAHNPLLGDLREQFVWGRFEYMQTGDTRLMREVLDMAITDAADPLPVGPIIDHGVDLRALAAATLGHRDSHQVRTGVTPAPKADDPCVDLSLRHHSSREPDV
ncbi:Fic family protein (plasmid) [Rhodococcus aetherivorans]|uniref:Fic/DOC family protein n=1 Tax=Rhodococcus aetherivorans TaxID=191292 RepID=UPI0026F08EA1|nr:Fic family protein [Rhodococcus aetherivorans]WKX01757.1 Fic family protein [Rhodococcus aetherivorans]